jgi:hypothetical protein
MLKGNPQNELINWQTCIEVAKRYSQKKRDSTPKTIVFPNGGWAQGAWSKPNVHKLHWQGIRTFFYPNVGGKMSFNLSYIFDFTIIIIIQQIFWILCNKYSNSTFETQFQLNSFILWITNIYGWKRFSRKKGPKVIVKIILLCLMFYTPLEIYIYNFPFLVAPKINFLKF